MAYNEFLLEDTRRRLSKAEEENAALKAKLTAYEIQLTDIQNQFNEYKRTNDETIEGLKQNISNNLAKIEKLSGNAQ